MSSGPLEEKQAHRRALRRLAVYILTTIIVSGILLIFNVGLVYTIYSSLAQYLVHESYAKQTGQLVLLVGPFVLLFPEWLLYDLLVSPLHHRR